MWNDIHNNAARLSENKILKSLASGKLEWETDGLPTTSDLDGSYLPSEIALPISADATQLDAICAAAQNKSFILHGPPGTGKSQTITNIIANALYQGKKILFVAEKMAALNKAKTKQLASLSQHLVSLPASPPTLLNIDHPERQLAQILELTDHGQKRDSHRDTKVTNVYVPGYYDRGKTRQNHFEAKAVVAEVVKRLAEAKRSHIQSSRTSSEGVAGIKAFLQYSEKGISSLPQKQSILTGPQKTFEKMLAQALQDRGYTVETNIGSSENTPT